MRDRCIACGEVVEVAGSEACEACLEDAAAYEAWADPAGGDDGWEDIWD